MKSSDTISHKDEYLQDKQLQKTIQDGNYYPKMEWLVSEISIQQWYSSQTTNKSTMETSMQTETELLKL
jgi:hypothetical protein